MAGGYATSRGFQRVRVRGDPRTQFWDLWRGALARDTPSNLLLPLLALWFVVISMAAPSLLGLAPSQYIILDLVYAILGFDAVLMIVVNQLLKKRALLDLVNFSYTTVIRPIAAGIFSLMIPLLAYMVLTGQVTQTSGSTTDKWYVFIYNVIVLAPVESIFFLWAIPSTWRPGAILSVFLFVFDHPVIRDNLLTTPILQLIPIGVGLGLAAFLFQSTVFLGVVKWRGSRYFGMGFAIGFHTALNTMITLFLLSILGHPLTVI